MMTAMNDRLWNFKVFVTFVDVSIYTAHEKIYITLTYLTALCRNFRQYFFPID